MDCSTLVVLELVPIQGQLFGCVPVNRIPSFENNMGTVVDRDKAPKTDKSIRSKTQWGRWHSQQMGKYSTRCPILIRGLNVWKADRYRDSSEPTPPAPLNPAPVAAPKPLRLWLHLPLPPCRLNQLLFRESVNLGEIRGDSLFSSLKLLVPWLNFQSRKQQPAFFKSRETWKSGLLVLVRV